MNLTSTLNTFLLPLRGYSGADFKDKSSRTFILANRMS